MAALSEGLAKDKVELNRILLQVSSRGVQLPCNFDGSAEKLNILVPLPDRR